MNDATDPLQNPARNCVPRPGNEPSAARHLADTWYPREKYYDDATQFCDGCPIKTACLEFALTNDEEHGVWGGTTPKERKSLLRKRDRIGDVA